MNSRKLLPILLISLSFLISFSHTSAQETKPTEYTLLAPIPLSNPAGTPDTTTNTKEFIPGLFKLMIAIATGLAVLMLIYAGIKYMSTDAFGGKEEAKRIIENALWGLLLAMSAWLIVFTINPDLVTFNLSIQPLEIKTTLRTGGTGVNGLSEQSITDQFEASQIDYAKNIILEGLNQKTITEAVNLRRACSDCEIYVTSATGGIHKPGEASHANGYKIDLRNTESLSNYVTKNYKEGQAYKNGDRVFYSPTGATFVWETHKPSDANKDWAPHWDITAPYP